jgi:hypothetical protein
MENAIQETISAALVAEHQRLDFLPRHFGQLMLNVEAYIYNRFDLLCPEYKGGYWEFYDLSNGGCYLAPDGGTYRIRQPNNYFDEVVSADAAGIIVTLYAMSELSFRYYNCEQGTQVFSERFYQLRDFALSHAEASLIFRAID